ncbi:MAG: hypothetical protein ACIARR_00640, partial [Phycisphaerales bacterium JB059]
GALAAGDPPVPPHDNLPQTLLPLYRELMNGGSGDVMLLGDSLTVTEGTFTYVMDDLFWSQYGIAGDGSRGLGAGFASDMRPGIAFISGPNTDRSSLGGAREMPIGAYTLAGSFTTMHPPDGALTYRLLGPKIRVEYVTQPGGGTFVLTDDHDLNITVSTDGAYGTGFVDLSLQGDPDAPKYLYVDTAPGSTGDIVLSSFVMRTGRPGYIQHYAGRGGVGPEDFLRADPQAYTDLISRLNPELVFVMLDYIGAVEPTGYKAAMEEMLDRVEAGAPDAKIVLVTHHPFHQNLYMEAFTYYELAQERGYGFVNLFHLFDGPEELQDLGYLRDIVHLSPAGAEFFGHYFFDLFEEQGRAAVIADRNEDGQFDFADVTRFIEAFAGQEADADLAEPMGVLDFNDAVAFLLAYDTATR